MSASPPLSLHVPEPAVRPGDTPDFSNVQIAKAGSVPRPPVDALTFVPGDPERSLKRGQNAAEALARDLAPRWNLPLSTLLRRREPGRPQRGLSREERRRNVRGSFTVVASPPARVALVDDVYTTGATVSAAATELRRAGARSVHVVTFARTVRR